MFNKKDTDVVININQPVIWIDTVSIFMINNIQPDLATGCSLHKEKKTDIEKILLLT